MQFKLHDALNDTSMKYPRAANRLLDLGMLLLIVGALVGAAVALGMLPAKSYFCPAMTTFVVGFVAFAGSKIMAGRKKSPEVDGATSGPSLKLVK